MKPAPRWIIPLESGQVAPGRPYIEVTITDTLEVMIERYEDGKPVPLCPLPSLAAVQLAPMLELAAAWSGQEQGRRDRRGRPEAPRMTLEEIVAHSEAQRAMSDPIARIEGALTTLGSDENPPPGWQKRVIAATKLCALLIAFVDQELDDQQDAEFRDHLAVCATCRARLAIQLPIGDRIRQLGEKGPT